MSSATSSANMEMKHLEIQPRTRTTPANFHNIYVNYLGHSLKLWIVLKIKCCQFYLLLFSGFFFWKFDYFTAQ